MEKKMECPHCQRCLGRFTTNDKEAILELLNDMPEQIDEKQFVYDRNCPRCKKQVFIKMAFKHNNTI